VYLLVVVDTGLSFVVGAISIVAIIVVTDGCVGLSTIRANGCQIIPSAAYTFAFGMLHVGRDFKGVRVNNARRLQHFGILRGLAMERPANMLTMSTVNNFMMWLG
jgi:hypothetical protein